MTSTTARRAPSAEPTRTAVGGRAAPGPAGGVTAWRNLSRFRRDAPAYFLELRRTYGDMVRLPLGFFTVHLPFEPDAVSYVLQEGNGNYIRGKGYDFFKIFMGTGLLTTDGDAWRTRRRVVNPLFHRSALAGMFEAMVTATNRVLDGWERRCASGTAAFDVVPESMHITLDALGATMFDRDLEPDHTRIGPAMDVAIEAMVFRGELPQLAPAWAPIPSQARIRGARSELHEIVTSIVRAHRLGNHAQRADLVSLLLAAQDGDGPPYRSDDDVRDELMTIFMAGHETTGSGLAWVLTEVALNPEIQRRAQDEVDRVLAGAEPRLEDLDRLPYVRQIIDEGFRLHPPIWVFPRDAVEDDLVGGYRVPAGESVFLCPFVTHRHPEIWSAPQRFDPDRFGPGRIQKLPRFAYFPFGGGQRKCIGSAMAVQQTHLTVAMILQRFDLSAREDLRDRLGTLVSLRPVSGLPLTIAPRHR